MDATSSHYVVLDSPVFFWCDLFFFIQKTSYLHRVFVYECGALLEPESRFLYNKKQPIFQPDLQTKVSCILYKRPVCLAQFARNRPVTSLQTNSQLGFVVPHSSSDFSNKRACVPRKKKKEKTRAAAIEELNNRHFVMGFHAHVAVLLSLVCLVAPALANKDYRTIDLVGNAVSRQFQGSACTIARIPWNLCVSCKLKPFTGTGNGVSFGGVNRFDIYDLSTPECQSMIRRYVEYNPCDQTRAKALQNLGTMESNLTLIYFMYSVCETCCDCIPIGAREDEYEERKAKGTLINIRRGNCAAHFRYDTCLVWNNAEQITGLKGRQWNNTAPWCQDFIDWQNSPNAQGWLRNDDVSGLTFLMRRAMKQLTRAARCNEEGQWKSCVRYEGAQGRV